MERILEAEYMDTAAEADEYDAMDHATANAAVVDRFLAIGGGTGRTIDLGTGPGDIPMLIAERCPTAEIVGVDAAATMLALAAKKIAAAGLEDRIQLERADVKALPFEASSFDAVLSNTILHHIPEPIELLREAYRLLKPGGVLLIRDLYRPATEAQAWAIVDEHAASASTAQRQLLFNSLHASLTLAEARAMTRLAGLRQASVEMTSNRHYTIECGPHVA